MEVTSPSKWEAGSQNGEGGHCEGGEVAASVKERQEIVLRRVTSLLSSLRACPCWNKTLGDTSGKIRIELMKLGMSMPSHIVIHYLRMVALRDRQDRQGKRGGHQGPCCSIAAEKIIDAPGFVFYIKYIEIPLLSLLFYATHVEDDSLTPQSPVPSPIMAAGSKFRSSRLKSLLILSVKSLFFSALQL